MTIKELHKLLGEYIQEGLGGCHVLQSRVGDLRCRDMPYPSIHSVKSYEDNMMDTTITQEPTEATAYALIFIHNPEPRKI